MIAKIWDKAKKMKKKKKNEDRSGIVETAVPTGRLRENTDMKRHKTLKGSSESKK